MRLAYRSSYRTYASSGREENIWQLKNLLERILWAAFWRKEGSRRAVWFLWISSSKLKSSQSQCAGNQAKVAGHLLRVARSFWHQKIVHKRWREVRVTQDEYRDTVCLVMQGPCRDVVKRAILHFLQLLQSEK